ncbi:NAD-dependent epimerase/dehydratase family protein [Pseudomonas sp. NFX5]|uniref:NAD-dependent epimerase/dehydratase family protein n=1 Tax=Pseudomonas sp. NFX5 TaxID=2816961 RepID=UPI003B8E51CD
MISKFSPGLTTLVIGGGGYIGHFLVAQLVASGRNVTVLGRSAKPRYEVPLGAKYIAGDFAHKNLICNILNTHQEVIHLAYATVPNTSFENPLADLEQNLPATVQLFAEVARRGLKLVLVSSGGTVYGEALSLPISEEHPTKPISPYGVTKLTLESYAFLYAMTHNLRFTCVRPANAYGTGQRPFIGQGFIATAIASSIKGSAIKVFGQAGSVRDYLYVSDVASGIFHALENGKLSEIYNLGSEVGLSNMDVIEKMRPIMKDIDCDIKVEHLPKRGFDVSTNILNSQKLKSHTGWGPKVHFLDGLLTTRDWLWKHRHEF